MWRLRIAKVRPKLSLAVLALDLEPIQDPGESVAAALKKPRQINVVWACLQQEEKVRFGTNYTTSCRNLLVSVNMWSCPGRCWHGSKVPVGVWKEDGREHAAGYQNSLVTCLLWRAPLEIKKKVSMKLIMVRENFLMVMFGYHWGRTFTQEFDRSTVSICLSLMCLGSILRIFLNIVLAITWWNCEKRKTSVSRKTVLRETMAHSQSLKILGRVLMLNGTEFT